MDDEGLVTIVVKLIGRGDPGWMSLPLYLPNPWRYAVAAAIARTTRSRAHRVKSEPPDIDGQRS